MNLMYAEHSGRKTNYCVEVEQVEVRDQQGGPIWMDQEWERVLMRMKCLSPICYNSALNYCLKLEAQEDFGLESPIFLRVVANMT